jgi:hypothetical protein
LLGSSFCVCVWGGGGGKNPPQPQNTHTHIHQFTHHNQIHTHTHTHTHQFTHHIHNTHRDRQAFKKSRRASLASAEYHPQSGLLVCGFSDGVFGLYELPGAFVCVCGLRGWVGGVSWLNWLLRNGVDGVGVVADLTPIFTHSVNNTLTYVHIRTHTHDRLLCCSTRSRSSLHTNEDKHTHTTIN